MGCVSSTPKADEQKIKYTLPEKVNPGTSPVSVAAPPKQIAKAATELASSSSGYVHYSMPSFSSLTGVSSIPGAVFGTVAA